MMKVTVFLIVAASLDLIPRVLTRVILTILSAALHSFIHSNSFIHSCWVVVLRIDECTAPNQYLARLLIGWLVGCVTLCWLLFTVNSPSIAVYHPQACSYNIKLQRVMVWDSEG